MNKNEINMFNTRLICNGPMAGNFDKRTQLSNFTLRFANLEFPQMACVLRGFSINKISS